MINLSLDLKSNNFSVLVYASENISRTKKKKEYSLVTSQVSHQKIDISVEGQIF